MSKIIDELEHIEIKSFANKPPIAPPYPAR